MRRLRMLFVAATAGLGALALSLPLAPTAQAHGYWYGPAGAAGSRCTWAGPLGGGPAFGQRG